MKRADVDRDPSLSFREYARAAMVPWGGGRQDSDPLLRYTLDGRSALYQLLKGMGVGRSDQVLLPAWVCHSVLDPIRALGAQPVFHDVDDAGRADATVLDAAWTRSTRAVIVIHLFGSSQSMSSIAERCRARGAALIEDCAHAWLSTIDGVPVGGSGDAAIFSVRKFLPLTDGGVLRVHPSFAARVSLSSGSRQPWRGRLRVHKDLLDRVDWPGWLDPAARALLSPGAHIVSRSVNGGDSPASSATPASIVAGRDGRPLEATADRELSPVLRRIIEQADIVSIVRRRRAAYARIHAAMRTIPRVRPFTPALEDGVCPWAYPFVPEDRDGFDRRLRERGIRVFTFGDPTGDEAEASRYPRAIALREQVLLLPCHQRLMETDVDRMIDAIRELCR